ncbi:hypothetical protein VTO73DRAFT_14233 [Trametes versicolor]
MPACVALGARRHPFFTTDQRSSLQITTLCPSMMIYLSYAPASHLPSRARSLPLPTPLCLGFVRARATSERLAPSPFVFFCLISMSVVHIVWNWVHGGI